MTVSVTGSQRRQAPSAISVIAAASTGRHIQRSCVQTNPIRDRIDTALQKSWLQQLHLPDVDQVRRRTGRHVTEQDRRFSLHFNR